MSAAAVATDPSALHASLMVLVEQHGLESVSSALALIRPVPAAPPRPGPRKSAKYAVTYEGFPIYDTGRAVLWWIPAANDPASSGGQAAWVPKVLVLDITRSEDPSELCALRTTKPVEWRYARKTGNQIDFTRSARL